jgi:hypothetical protein
MRRPLQKPGNYSVYKVAILFLFLIVATGAYSVYLGEDQNWDLRNYHLYNPFAALSGRYLYDIAPAQLQSYFNPLLDYPFSILIQSMNDWPRLIAFVQGTWHAVNLLCICLLAWHLIGGVTGMSRSLRLALTALAFAVGATGGGSVPLIGTTTGDLPASTPVLLGLLLIVRAIDWAPIEPRRAVRNIAFGGALAGIATGAKFTMGPYALAAAASLLLLPRNLLARGLAVFAVGGVAGVAGAGGPHYLRMWRLFGSPVFPLFNHIFHSAYWEASDLRDTRFLPKTLFEWIMYPAEWARNGGHGIASEITFRDGRIATALSLGLIAVVASFYSRVSRLTKEELLPRGAVALTIFVVVSYIIWLTLFSIYRYLIPLELVSGIVIVLAICAIARPQAWLVLTTLIAALCVATTVPMEFGHIPFGDRYVEIRGPNLQPDTLVVIPNGIPVSYLIPFFDRNVRWVSVKSNFLEPNQRNLLMQRARALINDHLGPLMMIQADSDSTSNDDVMSQLSLARDGKCASIWSNIDPDQYTICPVIRRMLHSL